MITSSIHKPNVSIGEQFYCIGLKCRILICYFALSLYLIDAITNFDDYVKTYILT